MLTNPASFNLSTVSPDSPLNRPASFASSTSDYPCPTCAADNSTLLAEVAAATAAKLSKWREAGYEVRPDGAPIIPGLKPEDCKSYSPECRFTYRDTFLSWDFLVDLDRARKDVGVEVVDRWDVRERALVEQLGVDDSDVYVVEDRDTYDFQFSDRAKEDAPLIDDNQTSSHYKRTVSIRTLATLEHRVVLLGSLFGTGRVRIYNEPRAHEWSEALGRAMAFRCVARPARAPSPSLTRTRQLMRPSPSLCFMSTQQPLAAPPRRCHRLAPGRARQLCRRARARRRWRVCAARKAQHGARVEGPRRWRDGRR